MLLLKRKKIAFFHIPKTAGSTIEYLLKYFSNRYTMNYRKSILLNYVHESLTDKIKAMGEGLFNETNIFTILRNPFDLSISLYSWIKTTNFSPNNKVFVNFNAMREAALSMGFNEWVFEWFIKRHPSFFEYLNIDGKIPDNIIVLDFENLKTNFKALNDDYDFGINCNLLDSVKSKRSSHLHFSELYNEESYELVREKYKWYFEEYKKPMES